MGKSGKTLGNPGKTWGPWENLGNMGISEENLIKTWENREEPGDL